MSARFLIRVAQAAWLIVGLQVAAAPADSPELLFQQAQEYANADDAAAAIAILDELHAAYPHDVDYVFARAQLLARLGRDQQAMQDLALAMRLAPDYAAVRELNERLLERQKGTGVDAAQWTLLAGVGHQRLDQGLPAWNELFAEVSRTQEDAASYRFGIAREQRFDDADTSVSLGGDMQFKSDWVVGLALAMANNASFRPDLEYSLHAGRALRDGWLVDVRYQRRDYATIAVSSVNSTLEKYHGRYRAAYVLGASRLAGARTLLNHRLTVNWYYNDRSSVGLTVNTGKEAEAVGPGQVLETDVRGISVSGRRKLSERFGLQWWLGLHDQGDYYRRDYLGLAVSIRL